MEHTGNSQDKSDTVPLPSSPATTSDSDGEVANLAHAELPPSSSPVIGNIEISSVQLTSPEGIICATNDCSVTNASNMPLLSPFAVLKDGLSSTHENMRAQCSTLQRALRSIPSSPPVPPVPSKPGSVESPQASNVLRSPFGIHLKSASCLSSHLFISSPEKAALPTNHISMVNQGADESHKDVNVFSDSGESTAGPPSTPKTSNIILRVASSSPYFVTELADSTICADGDRAKKDNHRIQDIARDLSLTRELCKPMCSGSSHLEELISTAVSHQRPLSPDGEPHPATTKRMASKGSPDVTQKTSGVIAQSSPNKRVRVADEREPVPAPKRMTLASQRRQHKKLASPFRSPLLSKLNVRSTSTPDAGLSDSKISSPISSTSGFDGDTGRPSTPIGKLPRLGSTIACPRTPLSSSAKAKTPFKSPLVKSLPTTDTSYQISSSRIVQDLERKVTLLKRAIKIKEEGDEEKLERLVKKWRAVGREAAWEFWQIVRDNEESSEAPYPGTHSKFQGSSLDGWGWAGTSGSTQSSSWGWDQPNQDQIRGEDVDSDELESPTKIQRELFDTLRKEPAVPRTTMLPPTPRGAYYEQKDFLAAFNEDNKETGQHSEESQDESQAPGQAKTLGSMLHQLGIAHETLGWVEDEGDFVDD
ncbi:hypothetical protein ACEPAH_5964 [Sanghuangporus vaninii]